MDIEVVITLDSCFGVSFCCYQTYIRSVWLVFEL